MIQERQGSPVAKIYSSARELIGSTPLLSLSGVERELGLEARLLGKLECCNPAGSAKDRVALAMLDDAEARGWLKPGGTVIEPTSGNTGIGLAAVGCPRGYRVIIVMPDTMSVERQQLMAAYGAQVVLTEGRLGMAGAIEKARQLRDSIPGSFLPDQFSNPANPAAHYASTGPEIWRDTDGRVDYFVSGVGTGGTISGAGGYLKAQSPSLRVVAVEPTDSPLLSGGKPGPHPLQGIGPNFLPATLDPSVYDEIIPVSGEDAFSMCRLMGAKEGLLVGISSGAALRAGVEIARREEARGKTIVVLLPDSGERYLSTGLFSAP